jgi:hypothetical protein
MSVRLRTACAATSALLLLSACGQNDASQAGATNVSTATPAPPESLPMGGAKSVTSFFVTSTGLGKGGDLGGLSGADAHCQALAKAEGSGDHTWRAYLSTAATANQRAVNARDRIGQGPWYNALGDRIAANLEQLHGNNAINKDNAVTERAQGVSGVDDTPQHPRHPHWLAARWHRVFRDRRSHMQQLDL